LAKHCKGIVPSNEGIVEYSETRLSAKSPWEEDAYAWTDGARGWVRVG
jgi:hypothetical protein